MNPPSAPTNAASSLDAKSPSVSAVEFEPPLACVRRILKNCLPPSTNVGRDASAAFARAGGIFIIYLTACANDFARENRRQTITANDVIAAVKELDFEEFTPDLLAFLERYRASEKTKKEAKAAAKAAAMDPPANKASSPVATAVAVANSPPMASAVASEHGDDEPLIDDEDDDVGVGEEDDDDELEEMEE